MLHTTNQVNTISTTLHYILLVLDIRTPTFHANENLLLRYVNRSMELANYEVLVDTRH